MSKRKEHVLFGGERPWQSSEWTASDDRVRGGKSQSYLHISDIGARFHGNLDIKTLGGAGFASQRTTAEACKQWNLSAYDGILLELGKSDGKKYTFILKDELLPRNPDNGREQATISWEYDFEIGEHEAGAESSVVFIPWGGLKPTYRGKEKRGGRNLDTKSVKRFSIMMRSFFGDQEGEFSLTIKSIRAISKPTDVESGRYEVGRRNMTLCAPFLLSLLGITVVACGLFSYLCPWIESVSAIRYWDWQRSNL